ncbi:MAG: WYL domain-containing protein [Alcanivorax sp.]|uniref:WYL domain-containing protein n=1 Tax=Alloalcanivorax venustensis ISO4 TaxID=1177184 RepID=A0ABS0AER8_9GAMM|nr:WYL domain-containing protein [Alcanivorax sp.]MBF5052648.1 hypothetical protein [Alloalcanivorax venustensis ISO4]
MSSYQSNRLAFIDFRLMFLGRVKRQDLVDTFSLSVAAATRDLSNYRERYLTERKQSLEFDQTTKSYIADNRFVPLFEHKSIEALSMLSSGQFSSAEQDTALIPSELPTTLNEIEPNLLGVITRAINLQRVISIEYRSHSSGFKVRDIAPFAIVNNGLRWHIRAYDRDRARFTDFVLARISNPFFVKSNVLPEEMPDHDIQWNRIVELELQPHPNLSNPETTEYEFNMDNGVLRVRLRAAVAGYVLRRWNVDCSAKGTLKGSAYQLWLRNSQALYGVETLSIAPGYGE